MAGAIVHFFLLGSDGKYRRGFLRYARAAYRNTSVETPTRLEQLYLNTRLGPSELQAAWEEFNREPELFDF